MTEGDLLWLVNTHCIYGWCIIELYTWELYKFINQCYPNTFHNKKALTSHCPDLGSACHHFLLGLILFLKAMWLCCLYMLQFKLLVHYPNFSPQLPITFFTYLGFTMPNSKSKIVVIHWSWGNILIVVGKLMYFLTSLFVLLLSTLICKF